jgi:5-methyltetrahydropteroyltriglutamate--homocysteine methyltransferase
MAGRTAPPFRADHVGSLLRPRRLMEARAGHTAKAELQAVEDDCVKAAIALQEGVGLKGITDGDMRRQDWMLSFLYGLDGIEESGEHLSVRFSGGVTFENPIPAVTGRIRCPEGGIFTEAVQFLVRHTSQTPKVTLPAPTMLYNTVTQEIATRSVYQDYDAFWQDVGAAYAQAIGHIHAAGCTYLQLDDVNAAKTGDARAHALWQAQGYSVETMVERFITVNNVAIANRPKGMTAAVHMCRGNFRSEHSLEGGYDLMAERYFSQVQADAFFMEYDDSRSGGFEPLRFMPKDRFVVLGLITSKRPELEDRDMIMRRIDEAARYVDIDRLGLSPQCGFASASEGNRLTEAEQAAKLEHVVKIATEVWGGV